MIKHIIFDLDGVLIDAKEIHSNTFIKACRNNKVKITKKQHKELCGLPTRIKLDKLGINGSKAEDIYNYKQTLTERELDNIKPDYDLIALIEFLKLNGLTVSCASNSINSTVRLALARLGIISLFDQIVGNDTIVGLKPKPSPEMYLHIASLLQLSESEILVIEDSFVGQEAIRATKMHDLMVKNRSEVTANRIIKRIEEIDRG